MLRIANFANSLFDDLGEQLEFSQDVTSGIHELITQNFLQHVTSEFNGEKYVTLSAKCFKNTLPGIP